MAFVRYTLLSNNFLPLDSKCLFHVVLLATTSILFVRLKPIICEGSYYVSTFVMYYSLSNGMCIWIKVNVMRPVSHTIVMWARKKNNLQREKKVAAYLILCDLLGKHECCGKFIIILWKLEIYNFQHRFSILLRCTGGHEICNELAGVCDILCAYFFVIKMLFIHWNTLIMKNANIFQYFFFTCW